MKDAFTTHARPRTEFRAISATESAGRGRRDRPVAENVERFLVLVLVPVFEPALRPVGPRVSPDFFKVVDRVRGDRENRSFREDFAEHFGVLHHDAGCASTSALSQMCIDPHLRKPMPEVECRRRASLMQAVR